MNPTSVKSMLSASLLALVCSQADAIIELDVVSVITQVGVVDGPSAPAVVGDFARYNLSLYDTVLDTYRTATLQVQLVDKGAGLTDHRITTGQGGNSSRVGISIVGGSTNRTGTYEFSFFNTTAFMAPLALDGFVMQVSDIDQVESVNVSSIRFPTITFTPGTQLTQTALPADRTVVNNIVGENLPKSEPSAVANFTSIPNVSVFRVILGGSGTSGREFQFDFTPDILVPEPSTAAAILGLVSLVSVVSLRRRR